MVPDIHRVLEPLLGLEEVGENLVHQKKKIYKICFFLTYQQASYFKVKENKNK